VDPINGFAYFGSHSQKILKVRLSDFSVAATLLFSVPGTPLLECATIDVDNGFAYFAGSTHDANPDMILKINLSNFTVEDTLFLSGASEQNIAAATIDTQRHFAYFGTYSWPTAIIKINLSNFTKSNVIVPPWAVQSASIDMAGGYAYFGMEAVPGQVFRLNLVDSTTSTLTFVGGEEEARSAVVDPAGGFAYFGTYMISGWPSSVVKVRLSDFTRVGSLTLDSTENNANTAVIDPANGFAYFGTNGSGRIVKVQLSDFSRVGALQIPNSANELVFDNTSGYAYGYCSTTGNIVRVTVATPPAPAPSIPVKIYPNPFRPSRGDTSITLRQLTPNGTVKIYSLSGQLVKSLSSNSAGTAVWSDVTSDSGEPAASGVYFGYAEGKEANNPFKVVIQR
jgi:hypothetical protein